MNYKVLLLDYDGIFYTGRYFSEIYSEKFGANISKIRAFMEGPKVLANLGKADLKVLLTDVMLDWKWKGTVDGLVEFWLKSNSSVDQKPVLLTKNCQNKGLKVYLVTNQEKYRTDYIWNNLGMKTIMDGKFVSCEMGVIKQDPKFFELVLKTFPEIPPDKIIYYDDSPSKLNAAKVVGIDTRLFTGYTNFEKEIYKMFYE